MSAATIAKHYVGTHLTPEEAYIKLFVFSLQKKCIESVAHKSGGAINAHNAMTVYTQQMLSFSTAHRAVSDPFFDLKTFDIRNSTVLIEDKVVSSTHKAHIAWLPELAILQLKHYLAHLRSLSRFMRQRDPVLADKIWAVTEPGFPHPIPLFFFIEEKNGELEWHRMKPSSLHTMLGEDWILPLNTNRHLLSTWLNRNGCHPEAIDAQLGHIEAGCYPFSARSVLSPSSIGLSVLPHLETYLREQGWQEIEGLKAPNRLPIVRQSPKSKNMKTTIPFGPEVRSINREAVWLKDAKAVVKLIENALPPDSSKIVPDEVIDALQNTILNDFSDDGRVLIRLSLFRRHLISLKREKGYVLKIPGRLALINKEPACFSINSSTDVSRLQDIKALFLSYLSSQAGECASQEKRIAEILISACIFGAQTSPQFFVALARGINKCIFREKDRVYVDIAARPTAPIRRWFPDSVTWPLVIGHSRLVSADSAPPSVEKINDYLTEILGLINAPYSKKRTSEHEPSIFLGQLANLARSYWRFRLPGSLRAYGEGEYACASVPLSNWVRFVSGNTGTLQPPSHAIEPVAYNDEIQPIHKPKQPTIDYKQAKQCWTDMAKHLGKSTDLKSGDATARSNSRKKVIEAKISSFLKNSQGSTNTVVQLIAAWIVHLCNNGTSNTPDLRASTVTTYARTIGEKLNALAYDLDFLSQSDIAIEEVYRNVLETVTSENRNYVAGRLKEFHFFLVTSYAMPTLDWGEVVDDDSLEADAVDAGIVSSREYFEALDILLSDGSCPERERLLRAIILFFAYRFGLRTGEIFRLTISDIIMLDGEMVTYIRNSIYGETKTSNGVRQLPLIGPLSGTERELVNRWLSHIETFADGDNLASLISGVASKRCVANRSTCVSAIVEVLRRVTGEPETRLRHLRHTCATRLYLAMFFDEMPSGFVGRLYKSLWGDITPQFVRSILIGDSRVSRRGLYAMAMYMGHASSDITHRHYIHLADVLLKEWIDREPISIDDKALAYAYQTSYANIRQLRSRHGTNASLIFISEHFTRKSDIPVPGLYFIAKQDAPEPDITSPALPGLRSSDVDRLLAIATMRDSIDGLADRFLTSEEQIISVLLSASNIQEKTGYVAFSIPAAMQDDFWVFSKEARQDTLDKESRRVRSFLDRVDQANLLADYLGDAVRIWEASFDPRSKCLLINKRSDLQRLLGCMKSVGIPAEDFEIHISDEQFENDHARWKLTQNWLESLGLSVHRKNRLPLSDSRLNAENRVGLILRASTSHELGYQQTLNRALFITAVWLSAMSAPKVP